MILFEHFKAISHLYAEEVIFMLIMVLLKEISLVVLIFFEVYMLFYLDLHYLLQMFICICNIVQESC